MPPRAAHCRKIRGRTPTCRRFRLCSPMLTLLVCAPPPTSGNAAAHWASRIYSCFTISGFRPLFYRIRHVIPSRTAAFDLLRGAWMLLSYIIRAIVIA
ncbi:hypothetical protein K525DRAFT_190344 [Schizophyllum commune Loenen D]|nr:hypothetical protein K525DRAFT_190344 [Schizophyllum commune Loenen D]